MYAHTSRKPSQAPGSPDTMPAVNDFASPMSSGMAITKPGSLPSSRA